MEGRECGTITTTACDNAWNMEHDDAYSRLCRAGTECWLLLRGRVADVGRGTDIAQAVRLRLVCEAVSVGVRRTAFDGAPCFCLCVTLEGKGRMACRRDIGASETHDLLSCDEVCYAMQDRVDINGAPDQQDQTYLSTHARSVCGTAVVAGRVGSQRKYGRNQGAGRGRAEATIRADEPMIRSV